MRHWSTRAAAWFAAAALSVLPGLTHASGIFDADATLTFLGNVGGQQRYRFDYTLTNTGEPLGLSAFQVFFNSDPVTQVPSGDKATLVSYSSPAGWGDVSVFSKNLAGQWSINWDYDFVSPPGPLGVGNSLTGFSVVFDWNDPHTIPPIQHAQARNGSAHSTETEVTGLVGLVGALQGVVSADCQGTPQAAGGITVQLLHEGSPIASTVTQSNGSYAFTDVALGTYTVVVIPPAGYGAQVDNQLVSLTYVDQTVATNFSLTCLLGDVDGTVTGLCNGQSVPLQGVTVDLFAPGPGGEDVLVASVGTDASGAFSFPGVALGTYEVHIVTPLGYAAVTSTQSVQVAAGSTVQANFALACQSISAEPRTIGYWKHQVNVYLSGKGKAQESLTDMVHYTDELLVHFSENVVNPVVVYAGASSIPGDRLHELEQLLTVNRGSTMLDKAKQQLLALLLNVVSGKIAQTHVISAEGATVSQAITHANDLIIDGVDANDETAKDIADLINNGKSVPNGMIPVSTRIITYSRLPVGGVPVELALDAAFPNPSSGPTTIGFGLPRAGAVELRIYDVTGRVVRTLVAGEREAGVYQETWDARDDRGTAVAPGIYFSRLMTADGVRSRRIALQR